MNRRGFIGGIAAFLSAPAIIRTPSLLMPVRRVVMPPVFEDDGIPEFLTNYLDPNLISVLRAHSFRVPYFINFPEDWAGYAETDRKSPKISAG